MIFFCNPDPELAEGEEALYPPSSIGSRVFYPLSNSRFYRVPSPAARDSGFQKRSRATIYPLIPTFYNQPKSFEEMAHQFACRVLQFVGLEQKDAYRRGEESSPRRRGEKQTLSREFTRMVANPEYGSRTN